MILDHASHSSFFSSPAAAAQRSSKFRRGRTSSSSCPLSEGLSALKSPQGWAGGCLSGPAPILCLIYPQVTVPRCPSGTWCPTCHRRSSAASPQNFHGACAVSWQSGWRTSPGESPRTLPPWSSTGLGVTQGRVRDPHPFSQLFPSPGSSSMAQTPSAAAWPTGCSQPCWRNSAALPAAMGSSARSCSKSTASRCTGTLGLGLQPSPRKT